MQQVTIDPIERDRLTEVLIIRPGPSEAAPLNRRQYKQRIIAGFTLVELLVVISILALLIAILLPNLSKARMQAKALVCATNLHSQGQAMQMYANEYNGIIPSQVFLAQGLPFAVPLAMTLNYPIDTRLDYADQFRKISIFQCPTFPKNNYDAYGRKLDDMPLDYLSNGFPKLYKSDPTIDTLLPESDMSASWWNDTSPYDGPLMLSSVRNVAGIIFLTEVHRAQRPGPHSSYRIQDSGPYPYPFHDIWRGSHLPRGKQPRIANDQRHPAGINMVFYDGHVETRRPESLVETDFYFPQ